MGKMIYNSYPLSHVVVIRELINHIARQTNSICVDNIKAKAIVSASKDNVVQIGDARVWIHIMIPVHMTSNHTAIELPYGVDASEYEEKYRCDISDILKPLIDKFKPEYSDVSAIHSWPDLKIGS